MKGIFSKTLPPTPLWKFQLSFIHFFKFLALQNLPHPPPQEIPIPSVGGVWIFSGTAHNSKLKDQEYKQKTSLKSFKTEIKIPADIGLA